MCCIQELLDIWGGSGYGSMGNKPERIVRSEQNKVLLSLDRVFEGCAEKS